MKTTIALPAQVGVDARLEHIIFDQKGQPILDEAGKYLLEEYA